MTFPIVLAHGVCRFDKIWSQARHIDNSHNEKLDNLHYFKTIRTTLMQNGFKAYHSSVSWAADVDTRADPLNEKVVQKPGVADGSAERQLGVEEVGQRDGRDPGEHPACNQRPIAFPQTDAVDEPAHHGDVDQKAGKAD